VAIAIVLAGTFLACDKKPAEIKIGGVGPLTGEAATFGVSTKNGYEMAVADANAKGGILGKQVKLIFADDKGDPAEGATVYTKLIEQDKVTAIIGTVMSKVCLAGAPICQNAQIPNIVTTATNPKITEVGNYIFRASFIDPFQGTVGAKFAFNELKARKAACLFDVGNDYTKGLSEYFKATFIQLGGQVVGYEGHASGTTDYKAQLTKILVANPDLLYVSDYYNDVALIAKQARELGFKGPMMGGDGWVEGCYFTNHYSPDDVSPVVQAFVKAYKAKFNGIPDAYATLAYVATDIMLDAFTRAGTTDGPAVKDALAKTDLACVTGQIRFDDHRNPVKAAVIIQIKDGKQVYKATVQP
jgi:branched-chain amino acid transport system substrate-binding protein